jgi:hypothetical protein
VKFLRGCSWKDLLSVNAVYRAMKHLTDAESTIWSSPLLAQEDVPDQVAEMFTRRSGTAPLTFSALEWPTSHSAHQLEIIASQLHRTKHLGVLAYQDRGFASFLDNLYKTDMKDLKELILGQSYDLKTHHLETTPSLCGGHLFHLISLKLKGFSIRGLPCAPSLQRLTLELARFSYEVLRTGLLSVHQLPELDIAAFQPDDQIHSRLLLELVPVSLPCLKSLKIRVEIFCLSSLLSLLPDPQVTFKLDIYGNDGASAPPVDDFELNQAMARVMRFWEATTGQPASWEDSMFTLFGSERRSGVMRSLAVDWGDRDSALNQVNTSHAHVSFEVSYLLATTPYASQIKEMLVAVSISNNLDDQFLADIDLDLLANVKTLLVDCDVDEDTELVPWDSRAGIRQLEE